MRGHRFIQTVLSGAVLLACAGSALAMMSVPDGWYLELNAGSTHISNINYPGNASTSGIGGNANVGYKFMPYLAGEVGYSAYPNSSIKAPDGTKAGSDKHYSYDFAAKGILPIACSGAEAFAKLGLARVADSMSISNSAAANSIGLGSSTHSATGLYMAAGLQYYFMPELAVVGQWARAQGNSSTGNIDLLSGGVSFIFD